MDEQNRNLLLATGLSVLVMVVWFALFPPQTPEQQETGEADVATAPTATAPTNQTASVSADPAATLEAALSDAPRVAIESPRLEGSLSLAGGRIDDLRLRDYKVTLDDDAEIVTLFAPTGTSEPYYAQFGWAPSAGLSIDQVPTSATLWSVEGNPTLTPDTPVTLTWDNGAGLLFSRTMSLDKNFMFSVEQRVTNTGAAPATLAPYGILARHGLPADLKSFFILHEGLIRMTDGQLGESGYKKMPDYDRVESERALAEVEEVTQSGWIGFTDHFWMSTLIPEQSAPFKSVAKYVASGDVYQAEAVQRAQTVAPGQTVTVKTGLFAGAKEWETIRGYQNDGGVVRFVDSIDWGWFYFLTKPIFIVLHFLHGLIGNMGWSIIALTLLIKALVLPLAYKSYVSMARMKELQPEIEALKEKAGEDKQKLQQGMMELYKKNKVNPASGCLPILMQVPIFFSLYKVIFVTIELRHAPWFGPFKDLSMPDPTSIVNLFGLLPNASPEPGTTMAMILIGILPLLLGVSMWMQQKLNPAPTDATQAMIFAWMPWVFMFMLGRFASGLIVYWIANNTITFSQQYLIMRSQGIKPDVFGNIKSSFKRKPKEDVEAASKAAKNAKDVTPAKTPSSSKSKKAKK